MAASKRDYMNYHDPLESEVPTEWLIENELVDLFVPGKDIKPKEETLETKLNNYVQMVKQGEEDALKAKIALQQVKKLFESAEKEIEAEALTECERHGAKTFNYNGYKVQLRNGSKKIDYNSVDQVGQLNQQLKLLKADIKGSIEAQRFSGDNQLVLSTGEMINTPTVTYSKDSITITKNK